MLLFGTMSASAQNVGYTGLTPAKNENELILTAIFGLAAIAGVVLFILFGLDKKVRPTVEVKPPDRITPAEAGFILDEHIRAADIPSLILYWANRGYLLINTVCEAGTDELEFIKLKNADACMKPYEKLIFDRLFDNRSSVALADVKGNFNVRLSKAKAEFAHSFNAPSTRFFTRSGTVSAIICGFLAGLCTGVMPIFNAISYNLNTAVGVMLGIFAFIVTACFCAFLKFSADKTANGKKFGIRTILYIVVLLIMSGLWGFTVTAILSSASAAVCGIAAALSKKHTRPGREMLGKLLGLKLFIATASKGRIELLFKENPSLFYDVLPFAFVLGVADKWAMQFENLAIAKPSWYKNSAPGLFNSVYFTNFIRSSMGKNKNGGNSFAIGAFAASKGLQGGSRTRTP
jgi:Predicted membrane protein (DUF2207).